jgi:hypothetical protein
MGYGLRWFIAEDDGTVTRVPAATRERCAPATRCRSGRPAEWTIPSKAPRSLGTLSGESEAVPPPATSTVQITPRFARSAICSFV